MTKHEWRRSVRRQPAPVSAFGFRASSFFRHSGLGIRHSPRGFKSAKVHGRYRKYELYRLYLQGYGAIMDDRRGFGMGARRRWRRWVRWAMCPVLAVGVALSPAGCTRRFFRRQADKEVCQVLAEKDQYPQWKIENYHVYPDPRARFADPTNPDRPPMPPDDPAACEQSPHPQKPGKAGVARVRGVGYLDLMAKWDEENRAEAAAARNRTEGA